MPYVSPAGETRRDVLRVPVPAARLFSTGGGTRRVQSVREEGRDVSSQYGREGGGLASPPALTQEGHGPRNHLCNRKRIIGQVMAEWREKAASLEAEVAAAVLHACPRERARCGRQLTRYAWSRWCMPGQRASRSCSRPANRCGLSLPPPLSCTKWTRLVLLPVPSGHVSSLSPY